ncbi:hypothetical protein G7Y89_g5757 [Cudoniella acicularis]|uniref:Uncharacterized protein n=1 Tax=Cudoniella acicularis TaxID=354080 RepID=A0A8H4RLX6_9HELO|nr:hypothetical protein G7Y89_g5757 [Cudoniella acicularis]
MATIPMSSAKDLWSTWGKALTHYWETVFKPIFEREDDFHRLIPVDHTAAAQTMANEIDLYLINVIDETHNPHGPVGRLSPPRNPRNVGVVEIFSIGESQEMNRMVGVKIAMWQQ